MQRLLYVGAGGFIGSALRYVISLYAPRLYENNLCTGTLIVNVVGAFLIGFVLELGLCLEPARLSPELRLFLTTGIMGGFTTFSTFSYESVSLLSAGKYRLGLFNIFLNLALSLGGVVAGQYLARRIFAGS